MITQELNNFQAYCSNCGYTTMQIVEAVDERTARDLYFEHHLKSNPRCNNPFFVQVQSVKPMIEVVYEKRTKRK